MFLRFLSASHMLIHLIFFGKETPEHDRKVIEVLLNASWFFAEAVHVHM